MAVEPRRALVTGAAGFIGSHVVEELVARDYEVAALDTLWSGRRERVPDAATYYDVDVREADLRTVIDDENPTVLVHLAALHSSQYGPEHVEETVDVNVFGTRNLLAAARAQHNVQRVVFASSASVYPPTEEPCPETLEPGPTDLVGKTKVIGEDLVHLFNEETDVPAASARLFDVYGPNATNPEPLQTILEQARAGTATIELGDLGVRRDLVHVEDAARALVELISHDWGYRAYNVGTGHGYTVLELTQLVESSLQRELEVVESADGPPAGRTCIEADISRISEEIGWEPAIWLPDTISQLL